MIENRFTITPTPLAGLQLVERQRIGDDRGFLSRLYCRDELTAAGFFATITQINHTLTRRSGTIRGLHFQLPPQSEDKFVSVLRGEVFDVAVDVRAGSSTFLQWYGTVLSAENSCSLFIPKGFAHGFQTLVDDCELIYLHTASYERGAEGGLNPLDPAVSIAWPIALTDISERDRTRPAIVAGFPGIKL